MPFTGQLATHDSRLGNILLGGPMELVPLSAYPSLVFEVNWEDDPIAAHRDIVMGSFPIAYWRLNETGGTTAADTSGNGRTGTYTGGFTLEAAGALADNDTAVSLNGTSGYIVVPSYSNVFNLTSAWSISAWVYPTATREASASDAAGVVAHSSAGSGNVPFTLSYGREDPLNVFSSNFWVGAWSGSAWKIVIDSAVFINEWVHYTATLDTAETAQKLTLYRNGVEVGHTEITAVASGTSGNDIYIGKRYDNAASGTDEFFPGRIDDVAIFNRALSPLEAAKLYASGAVRSDKTNAFVDYSGTVTANGHTTSRIRSWSMRRGRSSEIDRVEAGTLTIVLDNRDGVFNPDTGTGRLPMRLARLTSRYGNTSYPLFAGYIERFRYLYPGYDADAVVELTITDGFKALSQQAVTGFLRPAETVGDRVRAVLQAAAIPEDQQEIDDTYIYDANVAPARSSDVTVELPPVVLTGTLSNGSAVVTGISSTTGLVSGMAVTGGGIPAGTTIATVDSGTQITLSATAVTSALKTVQGLPNSAVLFGIDNTGNLSVGMAVNLGNNTNGQPMSQPGTTISTIDSASQITMSLPTYDVTFRGEGQPGGYANATFTASASQSLTFSSVTLPINGALDHIRQLEASELGVFLVDGAGQYVYQGSSWRDSQTVIATFGDTDVTSEIMYSDLPITFDEANIGNEYRVTNTYNQSTFTVLDPTSIRRYFPRLVTSDQVWQSNFYRLRQRTEPVPRIDSLVVKPARDPVRLWPLILQLEISDKVDVERHPKGGSDVLTGYTQFVEGVAHNWRPGDWTVTLTVSPEPE